MSRDPVLLPPADSELLRLVESMCDGAIAPPERNRLESLLEGDGAAKLFYVAYLDLHAQLQWLMRDETRAEGGGRRAESEGRGTRGEGRGLSTSVPSSVGSGQWSVASDWPSSNPQSLIPNPSLSPVPLIVVDNTLPSPLSSLPSFLFSYTIAALLMGIGMLIGHFCKVEHYTEFARSFGVSPAAVEQPKSPAVERTSPVARVTGLVDCRWSEPETEAFNGSHISKGRRFALASGLLQLTYDSGTSVILQGPCTYEVESATGGFLSLGKLTARIGERGERRGEREGTKAEGGRRRAEEAANPKSQIAKSQISNPQSPIPNPSLSTTHYPLFTVSTPTAVVTDLSTEFGVEVREAGFTLAHVFHGVVEVQTAAHDGQPVQTVRLVANESAQVEKPSGSEGLTVHRVAADPKAFVRVEQLRVLAEELRLKSFRHWQAYSEELRRDPSLLAYYDFQQKPGEPSVLPNVAGNGDKSLNGVVMNNVAWVNGRMAGKHALWFHSRADFVQVNLPQKFDDLTLAAWVCVESLKDGQLPNDGDFGATVDYGGLLMSDGWRTSAGQVHWQVRSDGRIGFALSGGCNVYQAVPSFNRTRLNCWTHLATVYDHDAARTRLYVDGQMTDDVAIGEHVPIQIGTAWIGHWNGWDRDRNLFGRIDELAIFNRPLPAEEIQRLYEGGRQSATDNPGSNQAAK